MNTMKTVTIYTDGACSGNPGKGGWGAILVYGKYERELCGGELLKRKGRYGEFIACSNYPKCKFIKKEDQDKIAS